MRKYRNRFLIALAVVNAVLIGIIGFDFGFRRGQTPPIADKSKEDNARWCRTIMFLSLLMAIDIPAFAQIPNYWSKVDTVTAGECDEFNPSLVYNALFYTPSDFLWVIFERHTSTESQIAARRFSKSTAAWDSSVVVIASRPAAEEQKCPGYSEIVYRDTTGGSYIRRLAAWQVLKENRWQIYYSTFDDGSPGWSVPSILFLDSLDNTCVQVHPFNDTSFIVTWKRANTIMWLMKSESVTTPAETLAVSSEDSPEYDVCAAFGATGIIWTSSVQGVMTPIYRKTGGYNQIRFAIPDTLNVPVPCFRPHLAISQTADPSFLFETQTSGPGDVYYYLNDPFLPYGNLTGDPVSDNRNARSFNVPYITKRGASAQGQWPSFLGIVVYERYRGADSTLVFEYGYLTDTVRTPGHNRNALVSSLPFASQIGANVLVVWESNRSGRSHIYSRLAQLYIGAIGAAPREPAAFELLQNYPNPFNPTTTIRYSLPQRSHVALTVYNTLGQCVATLVDETEEAGNHDVRFDGSGLASGVYYYRLRAGEYVATKRLVLVR